MSEDEFKQVFESIKQNKNIFENLEKQKNKSFKNFKTKKELNKLDFLEEGSKYKLKMFLEEVYHKQALRIDANFLSYYDSVDQQYYYYVEKFIGVNVQFKEPS